MIALATLAGLGPAAWGVAPEPLDVDAVAPGWSVEVDDGQPPAGPWWTSFDDALLDEVVRAGLAANPDLDAARARVKVARGARLVALAPLLPGINGSLTANGQPRSVVPFCFVGTIDFEEISGGPPGGGTDGSEDDADLCWQGSVLLNASWTIDLFGQNLLGHRAAVYEARASEGDVEATRLMISSSVASAYLDVVSAQAQVSILESQLASQQSLLEVLEVRYEQGGAGGLEVLQQRQQVAATKAALPTSRAAARSQLRALSALVGQGSAVLPEVAEGLPAPTDTPPIGQPGDLVRRRPDLKAAEARVVASRARHQSATRALLPSVSLNANAGANYVISNEFDSIGTWGIGGSVTVPVFNGGRLLGSIQQAAGTRHATVRAFDTALLGAVRDVESAVILEEEQRRRHDAVGEQVVAAQQAYEQAQSRYLGGIDSFLNVLSAQASLQSAELSKVQAHRDRLAARVQLWTALGGSTATGDAP